MRLIGKILRAGILLTVAASPVSVCANAGTSGPGEGSLKLGQPSGRNGKTDAAYLYKHPRRGYLIGVPAGVSLQDRGSKRGIILKSRKGYQITVQTNPTTSNMDLLDMLFRLETKYLGEGKPWSRKFRQNVASIGGLNAVEATYEGAGTRVLVIIARGRTLDYVFIFLASPLNFKKLVTEFDWLVTNFRPAPDDTVKPQGPAGKSIDQPAQQASNVFDDKELGFRFHYPHDWIVERQGKHVVTVSGKSGSPEYYVTVSMQNIKTSDRTAGMGKAVSDALRSLRAQIRSADNKAQFSNEGPYIYSRPGVSLHGGQFVVSYEQGNVAYKQWSIVLARPNEDIVHYWSYAAPSDLFLKYGDVAGSILKSWMIDPG